MVSLGWSLLEDANEGAEFGGTIGALGQALEDAGAGRGVVANADGADPLVAGQPIHREAALTMVDEDGAVSCGQVDTSLLETDELAPFGVRLDEQAVLDASTRCGTPDSVVLVEASDLRRAIAFRTAGHAGAGRRRVGGGPASTDALAGGLLDRLDLERDAVVVVAPTTQPSPGLGVMGIHAKEYRARPPDLWEHPAPWVRPAHRRHPDHRPARRSGDRRGLDRGSSHRGAGRPRRRRPPAGRSWSPARRGAASGTGCSTPSC